MLIFTRIMFDDVYRNPKYFGDAATRTIALQRKKIKNLQQQIRRLTNRVCNYKSLIKHLLDDNLTAKKAKNTVTVSILKITSLLSLNQFVFFSLCFRDHVVT